MSSLSLSQGPLQIFFNQFEHFTYDPQRSASEEIGRLRASGLWESVYGEDDSDALYDAYRDALTKEFNERYGKDENDLSAWHVLCARIGLNPIPGTLEECRELVTNTHVNLVDLVHVHATEGTVEKFSDVYKLSAYTIQTKKYFPRDNAHAGNLLKFLLRHILNPEQNVGHRVAAGKRKGGKRRRGGKKGPADVNDNN
ncbi:hypothetical protein D9619_011059 [Psilocybe cf. subviscida]|uniref:Uncharacterized protein n=1 Tax=Psilocybe cf. subviscida TaxID=2480587 RepID=A0A8H5BAD9_9AGAR|nr:hypothetical protein D9619_011059 [Psilocybe cf. subviscida]